MSGIPDFENPWHRPDRTGPGGCETWILLLHLVVTVQPWVSYVISLNLSIL